MKNYSGNESTQDQVEFIETWRGTVYVVRTIEEALRVFGVEV